ncbi:hypothetical protein AB6B39_07810 [Algimonas porphyrae]|uniref:hypothetical protein n=1 Tax=Algimonas porphyrae TaxID=1128113 RepID=UPI00352AA5F4
MADAASDLTDILVSSAATASADFLELPYSLYGGEAAWRAPLRMERRAQLGAKNQALQGVTPRFFLARRDGHVVGRIAAFTNARYDAEHGRETAFFGYFDCIDDPDVSDALLSAAKDWGRAEGRQRMVGPAMWSVNEEVGLLVDGYGHPPAVMMPYGHPHQLDAVTRNGFTKAVDLYAYRADLTKGAPTNRLVQNSTGVRRAG